MHVDFAYHPETKLDRRVNVLIYLNEKWQADYGGEFTLMDNESERCTRSYLPTLNRMIIFATNDMTYHGHPEMLRCPDNMSGKSIALYYYSNGRPELEKKRVRGLEMETIYKPRKAESLGKIYALKLTAKTVIANLFKRKMKG